MKLLAPISALLGYAYAATPTPTVMWHGLGDNCCSVASMGRIQRLIERNVRGVYVYSVCVSDPENGRCGKLEDTISGFIGDAKKQVLDQCQIIRNDPELQDGFNLLGFSQGGLWSRAIIQLCPDLTVKNFISIGGPQNGVFGFPGCDTFSEDTQSLCEYVRIALNKGAYLPAIQDHVIPAQYWHDPLDVQDYQENNHFLTIVNQVNEIDSSQVEALSRIDNMVLTQFTQDTTIIPPISEWFGFYEYGQDSVVVDADQMAVYKNLGLDVLDSQGKIKRLSLDSGHLSFSDSWFVSEIVEPYLDN